MSVLQNNLGTGQEIQSPAARHPQGFVVGRCREFPDFLVIYCFESLVLLEGGDLWLKLPLNNVRLETIYPEPSV